MNCFKEETNIVSTHTITEIEHYRDGQNAEQMIQKEVLVAVMRDGSIRKWMGTYWAHMGSFT